jgi:hypothetical protein
VGLGCKKYLIGQIIKNIFYLLKLHLNPNNFILDFDWSRYKVYKYGYNIHGERYRVYDILFKI